ncbi:PREDICTED: uncharacterized protein LOC106108310, partial [Papilio polytes]|uniref:uncharacterized protein LOC106108310 n=1 Tax=Papilio polytes TaxID=76194 RepID=UPI000676A666
MSPKPCVPASIEGTQDPKAIAELFSSHFQVRSPLKNRCRAVEVVVSGVPKRITAKNVELTIKGMTRGKSPGHDGLSIEHFSYAGPHLPRLLGLLFTLCIRHSYLPPDLMRSLVIPIVKNKTGDLGVKNNYRPITLATTAAKILDGLIELSRAYRLECGVRQGGLSSPSLFNLYINQLIVELSSAGVGCSIDGCTVNSISYADDMVLLSPSVAALRRLIVICEEYANTHGLVYNVSKSELILFRARGRKREHIPPIKLNGVDLRRVSSFKYLGHVVTEDLKDDNDIERERRAMAVRANMLARRFARCSTDVKITLFKAYCQSFYTCNLWISYTQRAISALRVQYNNRLDIELDIIVLTKCWLRKEMTPPNIDNYNVYYTRKLLNQNDGIVIYVRNSLSAVCYEPEVSDDHSPILLQVKDSCITKNSSKRTKQTIDYNMALSKISSTDWSYYYTLQDVNQSAEFLVNTIKSVIKECTGTRQVSKKKAPLKPWITVGIVRSIRKRDKLHFRTKHRPDDDLAKITYINYRNACNKLIKSLKQQYYETKLRNSDKDIKKKWTVIKEICNLKTKNETPNELLNIDNTPISSLNKVNRYFTHIGQHLAEVILQNLNKSEDELAREASTQHTKNAYSMSLTPTDPYEITKIINDIKSDCSPGYDNITSKLVKLSKEHLAHPITHLCNLSLEQGIFPDQFKTAIISPVFKPILLSKLEAMGIRGQVHKWFQSYLERRQQYIRVHKLAETGLKSVTAWLENNLLTLNGAKTKYLCFSKSENNYPNQEQTITLHTFPCNRDQSSKCNCNMLTRAKSVRYLGIEVDDNLSWKEHIAHICSR